MRKLIEKFIRQITNYLNNEYTTYYEEAPNNAQFPYCVIPTINISSLNFGTLILFDIEIYNNELSQTSVESIIDNIKKKLDGYAYNDQYIAFHVGFENANIVKVQEQDLIERRISFSVRIFEKGI